MSRARRQALLWTAQRASAAVLSLCVIVHLATMVVAVRGGLTASEIVTRVRGNGAWMTFYMVFVVAVAIHAPIGLRTVFTEHLGRRIRAVDIALAGFCAILLLSGMRAIYAVTVG